MEGGSSPGGGEVALLVEGGVVPSERAENRRLYHQKLVAVSGIDFPVKV